MIEIWNASFISSSETVFSHCRHSTDKHHQQLIFQLHILSLQSSKDLTANPEVRNEALTKIPLKCTANNILSVQQNQMRYKLTLQNHISQSEGLQLPFQIIAKEFKPEGKMLGTQEVSSGLIDLTDLSINYSNWACKQPSKSSTQENSNNLKSIQHQVQQQLLTSGFLSANYHIYDQKGTLLNEVAQSIDLYVFSMKVHFPTQLPYKRVFVVFKIGEHEQRFPLKMIQKNWLWYQDIFSLSFDRKQQHQNLQISIYSFDYSTNDKVLCYQQKYFFALDFQRNAEIKFFEDDIAASTSLSSNSSNGTVNLKGVYVDNDATIDFKYCKQNERNLKRVKNMTSKKYIENSFGPYQLYPDLQQNSSSILTNSAQHGTGFLNNSSSITPRAADLLSSSRHLGHLLPRSKYHSVLSRNSSIAIDRAERFPQTTKSYCNHFGYSAHQTLDINSLPSTQKYRYSSFGKGYKPCLKKSMNQKLQNGPGSGSYVLPSIFDRYK